MEGAVTVPVCPNCQRQVPYRQVSTNVNGNQGRLLAKVRSYFNGSEHDVLMMFQCNQWIHPVTNIRCNFFRWHPSPNSHHDLELRSFQTSPTVASSSQFQPAANFFSQPLASSQPPALPPAAQPQVVTPDLLVKCLTSGCNSARIRKGCAHQRCKHHCKERGGCLSHGNTQSEPLYSTSTFPPIFADSAAAPTLPPSSIANPSPWSPIPLAETQPPTTPPVVATQAPHRAEPTHASHILPIFTERWATEHSLREEQRKQDAEKLANLQKTKHTVFLYAWIQVSFSNARVFSHS